MAAYPFDDQFPLTNYPYSSRTWSGDVDATTKKNHSMVAFKAGSKLQASELNELQEILFLQNTLNMNMIHEWTSHLAGTTAKGPAWNGSTPLFPKTNPQGGTALPLVGYTFNSSNGITIAFREGWYLATLPSGVKDWVYNNTDKTVRISPTSSVEYYAGLSFGIDYITCTDDSSLSDNSSGSPNTSICGADRFQISFSSGQITGASGFNNDTFNKILSFTVVGSTLTINYINGTTL
jgi:hypothetical protein